MQPCIGLLGTDIHILYKDWPDTSDLDNIRIMHTVSTNNGVSFETADEFLAATGHDTIVDLQMPRYFYDGTSDVICAAWSNRVADTTRTVYFLADTLAGGGGEGLNKIPPVIR